MKFFSMFFLFVCAWIYNIYSIYIHWADATSFEATASILGVPVLPLGAGMGIYWIFN